MAKVAEWQNCARLNRDTVLQDQFIVVAGGRLIASFSGDQPCSSYDSKRDALLRV
jgi:hypothetical protein